MTHVKETDIDRFSGVYSRNELATYFASLDKVLELMNPPPHHKINFTLSSDCKNITVTYHPKMKTWNIEGHPITAANDIGKTLANHIALSFGLKDALFGIKNAIVLGTTVSVHTHEKHHVKKYIDAWKLQNEWIQLHEVTPEKANLKDPFKQTWLETAILMGQPDVAERLLNNMKSFKKNPKLMTGYGITIVIIIIAAIACFATLQLPGGAGLIALACLESGYMSLECSRADKKRIISAANRQQVFTYFEEHSDEMMSFAKIIKKQIKHSPAPVDEKLPQQKNSAQNNSHVVTETNIIKSPTMLDPLTAAPKLSRLRK